jgi:alpha-mannosidase
VGEETDAEIALFREPKAVKTVNMLEEEEEGVKKELKREGERIELTLKPFEIVTLKVQL